MKRQVAYALIAAAILGTGTSLALAQGRQGDGQRMMSRLDLNGDGAITPGEASAVRAMRFLRLDTNDDGIITEEEMLTRMQDRVSKRVAKGFAKMDRNGDGRVERAEFDQSGTARFARLDTDGDGRISQDEFRAQRKAWGRGRHGGTLPVE